MRKCLAKTHFYWHYFDAAEKLNVLFPTFFRHLYFDVRYFSNYIIKTFFFFLIRLIFYFFNPCSSDIFLSIMEAMETSVLLSPRIYMFFFFALVPFVFLTINFPDLQLSG